MRFSLLRFAAHHSSAWPQSRLRSEASTARAASYTPASTCDHRRPSLHVTDGGSSAVAQPGQPSDRRRPLVHTCVATRPRGFGRAPAAASLSHAPGGAPPRGDPSETSGRPAGGPVARSCAAPSCRRGAWKGRGRGAAEGAGEGGGLPACDAHLALRTSFVLLTALQCAARSRHWSNAAFSVARHSGACSSCSRASSACNASASGALPSAALRSAASAASTSPPRRFVYSFAATRSCSVGTRRMDESMRHVCSPAEEAPAVKKR